MFTLFVVCECGFLFMKMSSLLFNLIKSNNCIDFFFFFFLLSSNDLGRTTEKRGEM